MKTKYTTILYDEKKEMGVSFIEYVLLDIVFHLENNSRFDGCKVKKSYFAECLDVNERYIEKLFSKLEKDGWVISVGNGGRGSTASRKTTTKYKDIRQRINPVQMDTLIKETPSKVPINPVQMDGHSMISTVNNSITKIQDTTVANAPVTLKVKKETTLCYNSKTYLEEMNKNTNKAIKIIAWYINKKGIDISTEAKVKTVIKRNLKISNDLLAYSGTEIAKGFQKCLNSSKGEYEVTLETILKKLTSSKI